MVTAGATYDMKRVSQEWQEKEFIHNNRTRNIINELLHTGEENCPKITY